MFTTCCNILAKHRQTHKPLQNITLTEVIILKHNVSRLILLIVWFVSGAVKCNNLLDKPSIDTESEETVKLWFQ